MNKHIKLPIIPTSQIFLSLSIQEQKMSFPIITLQHDILYNENWNEEVDRCFIDALVEQYHAGNWNHKEVSYHVLLTAQGVVNETSSKNLSFKKMVDNYDVWWGGLTNKIHASHPTWIRMLKNNSLVRAYFRKGEPEFEKLEILFKPNNDNPPPNDIEIINTNDGSLPYEKIHDALAPTMIVVSDEEDEFVSPMLKDPTTARKRLFNELPFLIDLTGIDDESNSTTNSQHKEIKPTDKKSFPSRNFFPQSPHFKGSSSKKSSLSSCASSSQIKWFFFSGGKK